MSHMARGMRHALRFPRRRGMLGKHTRPTCNHPKLPAEGGARGHPLPAALLPCQLSPRVYLVLLKVI